MVETGSIRRPSNRDFSLRVPANDDLQSARFGLSEFQPSPFAILMHQSLMDVPKPAADLLVERTVQLLAQLLHFVRRHARSVVLHRDLAAALLAGAGYADSAWPLHMLQSVH